MDLTNADKRVTMPFKTQSAASKKLLKSIFVSTNAALDTGSYTLEESGEISLKEAVASCVKETILYDVDSIPQEWNAASASGEGATSAGSESEKKPKECEIIIQNMTTLAGARLLENLSSIESGDGELERSSNKIGILNFADAKKPGGMVLEGAATQEESIARSSTLYRSLTSSTAESYYSLHKKSAQGGFYTHTMIYSPNILLVRDDEGAWVAPLSVDVVSSAAVNARAVARTQRFSPQERAEKVEAAMRERAARILYAFELHGVRQIVLGAWGCGIFGNNVRTVAGMWADLLWKKGSRFKGSFDKVVFAVLGQDPYEKFKEAFEACTTE